MPNNFSNLLEEQYSKKWYLCRISPRRKIDDELVDQGGHIWRATITIPGRSVVPIESVVVSGTTFTKVTGTPTGDEYSYDESTGVLDLHKTSTPTYVIITYHIFYTSYGEYQYFYEDPTDSSTTAREWEPRLTGSLNITFSQENIIYGLLSINPSSITLANTDRDFQKYLTDNDSFSSVDVKFWRCIDELENNQFTFHGLAYAISFNDTSVTVKIKDLVDLLDRHYYSNSNYSNSIYSSATFSEIDYSKVDTPIRKLIGPYSPQGVKYLEWVSGNDVWAPDPSKMMEATCVSYNGAATTTNNRTWSCCFAFSDPADVDFTGTVTNVLTIQVGGLDMYTALVTDGDSTTWRIGDMVKIALFGGGTRYRVIQYPASSGANAYVRYEAGYSAGDIVTRQGISQVVVVTPDGVQVPIEEQHYTTEIGPELGEVQFTFDDNFEASYGDISTLDPSNYRVYYSLYNTFGSDYKHSTLLKALLEEAGLTTNAASFTAAGIASTADICFMYPHKEEIDFLTYRDLTEKILQTLSGYLSLNNDMEIEYSLIDTPSSASTVTDLDLIDIDTEINYDDLCDTLEVITYDKHSKYIYAGSLLYNAKYLHKQNRKKILNVGRTTADIRLQTIALYNNRRVTHSIRTKAVNFESIIGDDMTISRDANFIGDSSTDVIKVIEITKKENETELKGIDLLGV